MTIGFGGGLNGDGGSCKFRIKKLCIQKVENLIQISCNSVIAGQLFHLFSSLIWRGRGFIMSIPLN